MLIEVVVSSLLAAAVSWAEVREAIGECICVERYTHEEKEYFVPRAGQCDKCRPPGPETALSLVVDSAYEAAHPVLISLRPPGLEEASRTDPGLALDERTQLARQAYLGWDPFLRLLLGRLRAALVEEGIACPDCPEFEPRPVRHVDWFEYLPYLTAHVWPDPVVTPSGDTDSPAEEPQYGFHVCIGLNGVAEMRDPDSQLVQAGYLGAFHTREVMQRASAHFQMILNEEQFKVLDDDEARTRYLRRRLPEEVANDAAVKMAVCQTLDRLVADIGLVVDRCEETEAQPAPEKAY